MPWTLETTAAFDRRARKFLKQHRDLQDRFEETLTRLQHDPFDPKLYLHGLSGQLEGLYAIRLNYRYRVVLTVSIDGGRLLLLDIGSHDVVYR